MNRRYKLTDAYNKRRLYGSPRELPQTKTRTRGKEYENREF